MVKITFIYKVSLLAFLLFIGVFPSLQAQEKPADVRFTVHLLDYIAQDYPGAVADGKILSDSEYQEQKNLRDSSKKTSKALNWKASLN